MQPITSITNIELSSLCNNKCPYCPNQVQGNYRDVGLMTLDIYERTLYWLDKLVEQGTQLEQLNLFGIGEPTMNPALPRMIRMAREVFPNPGILHFNTNGKLMTEDLAIACRDAGITSIDITAHDAKSTAKTVKIFRKAHIKFNWNIDYAVYPNNWAGQINWTDNVDYEMNCPWLGRGEVMIMSNGDITTCCLDAFGYGIVGNVYQDMFKMRLKPFKLCATCHHIIPERMQENKIIMPNVGVVHA